MNDVGYFRFLPRCLPASSPYNAAVTAWLTSRGTFAKNCIWLGGGGRLDAGLKCQ